MGARRSIREQRSDGILPSAKRPANEISKYGFAVVRRGAGVAITLRRRSELGRSSSYSPSAFVETAACEKWPNVATRKDK